MHDKNFVVKIVRIVHDFCRDFVPWLQHRFFEASKFVNSDEGLPCVNTIEKIYLGLLVTVFALAIISLFRLSHFKTELRKVFDPRNGFTIDKLLMNYYQFVIFFIFYIKFYTCEFPIKDSNGMELNRWQKLTRKSLTISMEMIANVSSILISNVVADGMKILR